MEPFLRRALSRGTGRPQPDHALLPGMTLGLGVAALFVALTLVSGLLAGPPPFPDHAALAIYGERAREGEGVPGVSPRVYDAVGRPPMVISRGLARVPEPVNVRVEDRGLLAIARRANPGFLTTLGIASAESVGGRPPLADSVVVSYGFWKNIMRGDARAIGRQLVVNGRTMHVRAVLPMDFRFLAAVDLILPLDMSALGDGNAANMTAIARLAPGADMQAFSRAVAGAVQARATTMGLDRDHLAWYGALSLDRTLTDAARPALTSFLICALVVLAVAGINVSNLMLSRSLARAHDMAIRRAMGAGRWHSWAPLVRGAASVVGIALLLGLSLGGLLVGALNGAVPDAWRLSALPLSPDGRVYLATSAATVLVAFLAMLAASLPVRVAHLLRERGAVDARSGHLARRARRFMLLLQMTLATGLLALTVASVAHVWRLQRVPLGFDPENAIAIEVRLDAEQFPTLGHVAAVADDLRRVTLELPGVTDAALSTYQPVGSGFVMPFRGADGTRIYHQYALMTPGALQAFGLQLLRGRDIDAGDRADTAPVALVNDAYLAASGSPGVGAFIQPASMTGRNRPLRIVGVVADTHQAGAGQPAAPAVFLPLPQAATATFGYIRQFLPMYVVLRGPGVAPSGSRDYARALGRVAPFLAAGDLTTLRDVARRATETARRDAWLGAVFALPAVLLAALGLYSVQSVDGATRRRDLALRAALGARRGDLVGRVVATGFGIAATGVGAGIALALALRRQWFDGLADLPVVLTVAVTMLCVVLLAIAAPARRALTADPLRVLRGD